MSVLRLARRDALRLLEGAQAGSTDFVLSDKAGNSWELTGFIGDIGYSFDTDGNKIAGRTVCASFIASRVKIDEKTVTPCAGWRVVWRDADGKKNSGVVTFSEPDRTIGIVRVFLNLDMRQVEEDDEAEETESDGDDAAEESDEAEEEKEAAEESDESEAGDEATDEQNSQVEVDAETSSA